ncbi:MAG: zinc ribbon domain-containing protein [Lachnospiraceae bacterium]|nr:zinc ribbon domain-containing protein [Lachnospiraceae bacterium]
MKYCSHCGTELTHEMQFCPRCGSPCHTTSHTHSHSHSHSYSYSQARYEENFSLSCVLAYIPGLFWLPLVSPRKDERHVACAKQGLILTVLAVIIAVIASILWSALVSNGIFNPEFWQNLYVNWTATNWPEKLRNVLLTLVFVPVAAYVPINSICGFFSQMSSDREYILPIFGRFARKKYVESEA